MTRAPAQRALAALVLVAGWGQAQEQPLATVLSGITTGRDVPQAVPELVASARRSAEPLFEALCQGAALTRLQLTALELALVELPHETRAVPLRAAARREQNEVEREAALALLARAGERADFALALELGTADEPGTPAPRGRQQGLQRCLSAVLVREPTAFDELEELFLRADPSTREPVVRALAGAAGTGAAVRLAALLWRADAATKALLLDHIGRAAARGGLDDEAVSEAVRAELGNLDKSLVVLACGALEKLHDHAAIPELVVLLADGDASVRRQAHRALARLTGVDLPEDETAWLAWLDASFAWWDTRSEACRVALVSGSAAEAAAAVVELAHQRFRRDLVVQALELTFPRADTDVVASALAALAAIPDPRAQRALQRYRDEASAELSRSAVAAHQRSDQRLARAGERPTLRPPGRRRTP